MIDQTARAQDETIQTRIRVVSLDTIEQTSDHVVTTGSLTTGKDHTNVHDRHSLLLVTLLECNDRHSVSVREQFLDFFLIGY